jgi:DNA-binding NarL/FixJ family response regulator
MSKAKKAAKEPKAKMARELKYDPSRVLRLWEDGKSISEIAEAMKPISKVFVHRTLSMANY